MALKPNLRRFAAAPLALLAVAACASVAAAGPFQSPSGNIGCYALKTAVRCDIRHREWKPPPKPARCPLDWGQGVSVGAKGRAHIVCAGDTTLGVGRKLPYGRSIAKGPFRCVSMRSGMRCVNRRSGHGFFLSRKRYRLF
jgi:hypothetical protein